MDELKRRIESLDAATSEKEIELGESQRILVRYNQSLEEIEHWLNKIEQETTLDTTVTNQSLPLESIMAICIESGSNKEQIHQLTILNDNPVCVQDDFHSPIQRLTLLTQRQQEINTWIDNKTQSVSYKTLIFWGKYCGAHKTSA